MKKNFWFILALISWIGFSIYAIFWKINLQILKYSLLLPLIDFIFETSGKKLNLWRSHNSFFFLGGAPIELLVALVPISYFFLFFSSVGNEILYLLIVGLMGSFFERELIRMNYIEYRSGWNSFLAFASYLIIFSLFLFGYLKFC